MKVYSVRECSSLVAGALQKDYIFKNITISGNVSNLHFHFSGVIFFSLIDEESRITLPYRENEKRVSWTQD